MNIYDIVLDGSYTVNQILRRTKLLKSYYQDQLFHSKNFKESDFEVEDIAWFNSLDKSFFKDLTNTNFIDEFKNLDQQISDIKSLVIYLPFELPPNEMTNLGIWLRKNINPTMVFDVKSDYDLIGGCRLVWKGISRDYSLKGQIEAKKDEILASFVRAFK